MNRYKTSPANNSLHKFVYSTLSPASLRIFRSLDCNPAQIWEASIRLENMKTRSDGGCQWHTTEHSYQEKYPERFDTLTSARAVFIHWSDIFGFMVFLTALVMYSRSRHVLLLDYCNNHDPPQSPYIECQAEEEPMPMVASLVWRGRESNPGSADPPADTLTIQPMEESFIEVE